VHPPGACVAAVGEQRRHGQGRGCGVSVVELGPVAQGPREDFGRKPPQDIAAEQSVLGGMMLSKDAIADVVEVVRANDFYRPAHELVFEAIITLYGRGEPADAVTVSDELTKQGLLGRIGGAAYLHELISSVPTAANAGYYAKIVQERAVLRRLVEAGTRIVQLGYAQDGGDVEEIVNSAQAEIYKVAENRTTEDFLPLSEIMEGAIDEIEAAGNRGDGLTGIPTGFADLDRLTNGLHPGQMIVIAARPAVGKSTFGLDIARAAAIHAKLTTVVFSLEMSKNEITMRLLSAEARIPLQNMRKGTMREEDWTRLARTMGEVSEAPLFIDDSPNMSLMEIRAKCRRLKQRHDLKLVMVDYLQLMTSGKRVENRQQEVSEFSRALKLLAKELEVPVIALSQLNRGPEQRTDKRPMVSDLRESGCLTADTRVLRADTGAEVTLGELYASGATDVPVWSLDDSLRYVRRHLTHVFPTGRKPVFKVRLRSGKVVRATANHPFLTYQGWRPIGELAVGHRVAVPRQVPAPELVETTWADEHVDISGAYDQRRFLGEIGVHGARGQIGAQVLQIVLATRPNPNVDTVPVEVWDQVRSTLSDKMISHREFAAAMGTASCGSSLGKSAPSRHRLARVAELLEDADLEVMAVNDVLWDEVVAVDPDGEEEVFDATVLGTHNFVANGIAVHNSIEQDADMVILLHREDMYEKESPRAGEADFIVAKHRNGPTDTIVVAFQGHYSRFVDMAS
jgi:replicative DNA helicase